MKEDIRKAVMRVLGVDSEWLNSQEFEHGHRYVELMNGEQEAFNKQLRGLKEFWEWWRWYYEQRMEDVFGELVNVAICGDKAIDRAQVMKRFEDLMRPERLIIAKGEQNANAYLMMVNKLNSQIRHA